MLTTQKIICLALTTFLLTACGQIGPLYIPDNNAPEYTP